MKDLNYLTDILYQISKINFERIVEKHDVLLGQKTKNLAYNPPIRIYVIKIENEIPKTMRLLSSTKYKITKDKNDENVPHLEITRVVLVHYNIVNNDYQPDSWVLYTFVPNKLFDQSLDNSAKKIIL